MNAPATLPPKAPTARSKRSKKSEKKAPGLTTWAVRIVVVLAVFGVVVYFVLNGSSGSEHKRQVTQVVLLAPPPPPPPKPPPPPPPKKMIEQTPVDKPEPKPDNTPKSAPIGPSTMGKGGLAVGGAGGNGSGGSGGGSRWGWYASGVQNTIHDALKGNNVTSHAHYGTTGKIWLDVTGRITRAELDHSTGNPAVDDAIINNVLTGLGMPGGPPPGMPMPIHIRMAKP